MRTLIIAVLAVAAATLPAIASAQTGAPTAPQATTGEAGAITQTTATLTGQVDANGTKTTYRFEYGTTDGYGLETPVKAAGAGEDAIGAEADITALTSSTTYHYRLVAANAAGVSRGADRTFKTAPATPNPGPPSVTTSGTRGVGATTATLVGWADPNRASTQTRFEYGTSTAYGTRTSERSAGSGDSSREIAIPVSRLRPRTTYHFRIIATNAAGSTQGRDRTFRTSAAPTGISAALDADLLALGGTATVTGKVSGTGVGSLPVALEAQPFPFGATPFAQVGRTVNTSGSGAFKLPTAPLLASARLRVITRSRVRVTSATLTALVRLRVGARAAGDAASRRRAVISGTVTPATAGARVSVQRETSTGRFTRVGRTVAESLDAGRSRYAVTIRRTTRTSIYRVSVLPPDAGPHVRGTSRTFRVRGAR